MLPSDPCLSSTSSSSVPSSSNGPYSPSVELLDHIIDCAASFPNHLMCTLTSVNSIRSSIGPAFVDDPSARNNAHPGGTGEDGTGNLLAYIHARAAALELPADCGCASYRTLSKEEASALRSRLASRATQIAFADIFLLPLNRKTRSAGEAPQTKGGSTANHGPKETSGVGPAGPLSMCHLVIRYDAAMAFVTEAWREVRADGVIGRTHLMRSSTCAATSEAATDEGENAYESLLSLLVNFKW